MSKFLKRPSTTTVKNGLTLAALTLAVGSSISWNPEHFLMARSEVYPQRELGVQVTDMALETPAKPADVAPVDGVDPAKTIEVNTDGATAETTWKDNKGNVILQCQVKGKIVTGDACKDIVKVAETQDDEDQTTPVRRRNSRDRNRTSRDKCKDEEGLSAKLDCQILELNDLRSDCEGKIDSFEELDVEENETAEQEERYDKAKDEVRACKKAVNEYFNKHASKSLSEALMATKGTSEYSAAAEFVDGFLSETKDPVQYEEVRRKLISMTEMGTRRRALKAYDQLRIQNPNQAPAQTINQVKQFMRQEILETAFKLCQSASDAGQQQCYQAAMNPNMMAALGQQTPAVQMVYDNYYVNLAALYSMDTRTYDQGQNFMQQLGMGSLDGSFITNVSADVFQQRAAAPSRNNTNITLNGSVDPMFNEQTYTSGVRTDNPVIYNQTGIQNGVVTGVPTRAIENSVSLQNRFYDPANPTNQFNQGQQPGWQNQNGNFPGDLLSPGQRQ